MTVDAVNGCFAVVDVETNWNNEAMSIGIAIGDAESFNVVDKAYYVIHPECETGGMYYGVLRSVSPDLIVDCSRKEALGGIVRLLARYGIKDILAYNAPFDCKCLYELSNYTWRDILPVAANRNYNGRLPDNCEYYSTGLLKRGRGVENVMRLIYRRDFCELHNGLQDALDELHLMRLIGVPLQAYREYKPKQNSAPSIRQTPTRHRTDSLLEDYRYVVDELCGGSVRLIDFSREMNLTKNGEAVSTTFTDYFYLQCSRCGHRWTADAEAFFNNRKCPKCQ